MLILLHVLHADFFSVQGLGDMRGRHAGQTVATFLTLPASASLLAKNMIATPGTDEASDVFWAPANTAFFDRHTFGVSHLEWLMGLRKELAAASFSLLDIGTVGIYSQVFSLGGFDHARTIDESRSDPTAVEYTVGGSLGRVLIPEKLACGIQLSFLESRLDQKIGRAGFADLDVYYRPHQKLSSRLYLKHLGTDITYTAESEPLPLSIGAAFSFSPRSSDTTRQDFFTYGVSAGVQKRLDEPLMSAGGVSLGIGPYLKLHSGYEHGYGRELTVEGLSAGISMDYQRYGVDAGWKYQSAEFGPVWAVSVRYKTEELIPKNAHDYYVIAKKHFTKKRYRMAIRYAKKALRVNANFWQAHQLINETVSLIRRNSGVEIGLVYSGNIRGQFFPATHNGHSLGGLSRVASVISTLKSNYPLSVAIETGNLITSQTHPIKTGVVDTYLREVDFDALVLGLQESAYGTQRYGSATDGSGATFICTNCDSPNSENLVRSRIVSAGKYRVAILSLVGSSKGKRLNDGIQAIQTQLLQPAISSCDIKVVVFHETWETITRYLSTLKEVDFALCGSLDQKFDVPMKVGKTIVLSAGSHGHYVGLLKLRFDKHKNLQSFTNRLVPVSSDIEPHAGVEKEVQRLAAQVQFEKQHSFDGIAENADTTGLFPFLSDRQGRPQVFLKSLHHHADFPMTPGSLSYDKPVASFNTGYIASIAGTQNDSTAVVMNITGVQRDTLDLQGVTDMCFGPSGSRLYVSTRTDSGASLYSLFADGSQQSLLFTWPRATIKDLTFSSSGLMGFSAYREDRYHVFVSDTSSWKPIRLSDTRAEHIKPLFSANSRYISWLSDKYSFGGRKDLWIHDLHTGKTVPITRRTAISSYCWLDERTIIYATGETLQQLYSVDIFSRNISPLITKKVSKQYHEHSPRLLQTDRGTKIMYVREDLNGKRRIYWVNTDGSEDQRLTASSGSEWFD